jgi:hypothetical protein
MNRESKYYCHWADRGLAMHNSGGALVCCHSRTFLKDNNNQQIFWHTHTLDDAWNSPTRREIQDALDNGIQHPNCDACWDEENIGGTSRRQHYKLLDLIENENIDAPLLLDLKLGNICNLSCRTCNPYVSSQWTKDWWRVFEIKNNRFKDYDDYFEKTFGNGRSSYDKDNHKFWNKLNQWLPHAQYIDIYGAEPMLIHKLFDVLQHSIDNGYAKDQTLHFNTNGTIWNQQYIDILSKFKKVWVDVSIDGLFNHYDYIRNGETWDVSKTNLDLYYQFGEQYKDQHHISICITVSIYNIYYLDEIFTYFGQQFDNQINRHFNFAHMPYHVNLKVLPGDVKQKISEKLLSCADPEFLSQVRPVISYMNETMTREQLDTHYKNLDVWEEFIRSTWELDQLRSQNFAETFLEFYSLLKPHLNGKWE